MRLRTLKDVAAATGGRMIVPDGAGGVTAGPAGPDGPAVTGVSIDSRSVRPGDLFVALAGERTDGHRFVGAALDAGASAALVAASWAPRSAAGPLVEVGDTGVALTSLAADERTSMAATVVGITGSTGKTCTKDFAAAVLGTRRSVVASPASFNNDIGLPLTILSATAETDTVVCEMGARGMGHIRALCDVARPSIGLVTNVGVAHLGLFGSREAIVAAKAELVEALPDDGVALLFADDPVVAGYAARTNARAVTFGLAEAADVRAESVQVDGATGRASFVLVTPAGRRPVALAVSGEHMVPNALAAAALGWVLDVPVDASAGALATAAMSGSRMDVFDAPGGIRVIDDAYNANPTSMEAALTTARRMAGHGRCIAVLGEMAELGPISDAEHERVGELLVRLRMDGLVVVGAGARCVATAAEREGMAPDRIRVCDDVSQAVEAVGEVARPGDVILVKASRVVGLDRVAAALREARSGGGVHRGALEVADT